MKGASRNPTGSACTQDSGTLAVKHHQSVSHNCLRSAPQLSLVPDCLTFRGGAASAVPLIVVNTGQALVAASGVHVAFATALLPNFHHWLSKEHWVFSTMGIVLVDHCALQGIDTLEGTGKVLAATLLVKLGWRHGRCRGCGHVWDALHNTGDG
jgi:hypothetical protein